MGGVSQEPRQSLLLNLIAPNHGFWWRNEEDTPFVPGLDTQVMSRCLCGQTFGDYMPYRDLMFGAGWDLISPHLLDAAVQVLLDNTDLRARAVPVVRSLLVSNRFEDPRELVEVANATLDD